MPTDGVRRTCSVKGCNRRFTRQQGSNRLKCFDCAPERTKSTDSKIINGNFGQSQDQDGENQDQEGPMTRMSRLRLEELGVTETWQAAAVMALAVSIDEGKMAGTAGIAGIIRGHREAMAVAEALSNVDDGDVIDAIFGAQEA